MVLLKRCQQPNSKNMFKLAHLPNQEGFKFWGITKDNRHVACVVKKQANGCYYVSGVTEPAWFNMLKGWERQA